MQDLLTIRSSSKGLLYAVFTAFLWGFLAIALKVSLNSLNPVTVVWLRFIVAFMVLLVLLLVFDRSFIRVYRRPPLILFAAALFLGFNYLGFISGVHQTSPANAQVFIQIGPVTLAFVGILFFKEKITWKHLLGFGILVCGLILFYSEQLSDMAEGSGSYSRGITFIILGALSWACFSTLQKIMVKNRNPNHLNIFIYGFCALIFLPFIEFSKIPSLAPGEWALLIFLGINTVLAYGSLALALKYAEANKISVILIMNPVITFITMALLELAAVSWIAYENFTWLSLAGTVLVLGGAIIVVVSRSRKQV